MPIISRDKTRLEKTSAVNGGCDEIKGAGTNTSANDFRPFLDQLGQLVVGYRGAKALFVAAELDLFSLLDETDGSFAAVARRAAASPRHIMVLLDALAAIGFIRKADGRYSNTDFSRVFLHPSGAHSLANNLRYQEFLSGAYAGLAETARRGKPKEGLGELLSHRPEFVRDYIRGMVDIARGPAQELAESLDLSQAKSMLDVGGGPGIFTLALLKKNKGMKGTILDLPETLVYTRKYIVDSPVAERVSLLAGDYHKAFFGRDEHDLVLLSHVTHDEGESANIELLRKAFISLRSGGRVVIHDFMTNEDGISPAFGALFSVHLMSYTNSGRTYSSVEYHKWLTGAGFASIQQIQICPDQPNGTVAMVAFKR